MQKACVSALFKCFHSFSRCLNSQYSKYVFNSMHRCFPELVPKPEEEKN